MSLTKVIGKTLWLALTVCLLLLLVTVLKFIFWPQTFAVPIYVNNELVLLNKEISLKNLTSQLKLPAVSFGRLLDVDGKLLHLNYPIPPLIKVNGLQNNNLRLQRGNKINITYLTSKEEPVKKVEQLVSPVTLVKGRGVFASLTAKGSFGKKEIKIGKYSNKIITATYIALGKPSVIKRSDVPLDKVVALTFDDGPSVPFTNQVIDILQQQQVKATFFVVGRQVALFPNIIRQLTANGFLIGNHSFSHSRLDNAPDEILQQELDATRDLIVSAGGQAPHWFRPPFGSTSDRLPQLAAAKGYRVVSWNVDSLDWQNKDASSIVNQVLSTVKPGAIVLLHDGGGDRTNTVAALPQIIQALKEQGYKFVTLDELVGNNL